MTGDLASPDYTGDLGDSLACRWSTAADADKIGHFLSMVWRSSADAPPNPRAVNETRMYMSGAFPHMEPGDFALVEDTGRPNHPIVAAACFWRHRWSFAGIEFGVGRPENVATDPAYRNRGLVRALFAMHHARSAVEGHLMQAITGIPYFYRQFGYEYVLDLGGYRTTYLSLIPERSKGEREPYTLRLATLDDLPLVQKLYDRGRSNSLVWHEASTAYWRHLIEFWHDPAIRDQDPKTVPLNTRLLTIAHQEYGPCGYLGLASKRWGTDLEVYYFEVTPQVDQATALPSLLRLLRDVGETTPYVGTADEPFRQLLWFLGRHHPVYDLLGEELAPRYEPPYAWYIRVPDLLAFLQLITPVLNERLAGSVFANYTGEIKCDLYRSGLLFKIEHGRLVGIDPWRPPPYDPEASFGCPPLVFLQLLLGYRSMAELSASYPDASVAEKYKLLIDTLFPKQQSRVHPL
jgi:GNAT superfamily N-acetyltransferase